MPLTKKELFVLSALYDRLQDGKNRFYGMEIFELIHKEISYPRFNYLIKELENKGFITYIEQKGRLIYYQIEKDKFTLKNILSNSIS